MTQIVVRVRVCTNGQTTDNQISKIRAAVFEVEIRRVASENVPESHVARERESFRKWLDRTEEGDILVMTKMDLRHPFTTDALRQSIRINLDRTNRIKSSGNVL